jgi:hypothetical protein
LPPVERGAVFTISSEWSPSAGRLSADEMRQYRLDCDRALAELAEMNGLGDVLVVE